MYETFPKKTQHPNMAKGNQKSHNYLGTAERKSQRTFPSTGAVQQEHPEGNEQHNLKKKGSGLIGAVSCSGKGSFGTEKPANWKLT